MKIVIWTIVIVLVLAIIGTGAWFFFLKKSDEGDKCRNTNQCVTGLNCLRHQCSSGKSGSVCNAHKDCQTDLTCQQNACTTKVDYTQYFSSVEISKMKPGTPPGPNNPLTVTNSFTTTDGIEIDFKGVKPSTIGDYYVEMVNTDTGEVVNSTKDKMNTAFAGRDIGMGTDLSSMPAAQYDLNVYYQNRLIYTTPITIN